LTARRSLLDFRQICEIFPVPRWNLRRGVGYEKQLEFLAAVLFIFGKSGDRDLGKKYELMGKEREPVCCVHYRRPYLSRDK
jgi:hypothetical protein